MLWHNSQFHGIPLLLRQYLDIVASDDAPSLGIRQLDRHFLGHNVDLFGGRPQFEVDRRRRRRTHIEYNSASRSVDPASDWTVQETDFRLPACWYQWRSSSPDSMSYSHAIL
jgi:hypothetical protein